MISAAAQTHERSMGQVLIVDDSIVARAALGRIIDASGRYSVAGTASNVRAALDFLARNTVDIILLDLELPGVDGLTALPDLLAASRGARVLVVSATAGQGAIATIQALALGAADTLEKPAAGGFATRFAEQLTERLDRLAGGRESGPPHPRAVSAAVSLASFDIIAIGASTGGIHALTSLLRGLPATMDAPILVTQHLPASFMPYFAAQLSLISGRPCDVAENHMRVRPGRIVVAPGTAHLCVARAGEGLAVRLTTQAVASGCLPSVDPMFASLAQVCGDRTLAIVLSGMGRDGCAGAATLRATGASVLVQDRASSVVWGMPGAIASGGGADAVLPPEEIARAIVARAGPR